MTELATIDAAAQRKLNAILGASQDTSGSDSRLPLLKVNSKRKNAEGKKIPEGQFVLSGLEEDVFAESVMIRPLSQTFQWLQFDPEAKKVANKTVIVPNFRTEPIDMKGTLRCGKPPSKILRELDRDEQKKYEDIKCYRQIRCLVTYEGKTAANKAVSIENQPAILLLKGSNFSPFEDQVVKRLPQGRNLYDFWVKVNAKEMENGSVVYWVMQFEPDLGTPVGLSKPDIDTMYRMADMIQNENAMVKSKYNESIRAQNASDGAIDSIATVLEDDFEDEENVA